MLELILSNTLVLGAIAATFAIVLYIVSKRFAVFENLKIRKIESALPGANCGACGKIGCKDFAEACATSTEENFSSLYCPVGGKETMSQVAELLGFNHSEKEKKIAVLKCNGTCENAPEKIIYSGLKSCRLAATVSVGKTGCPNGCLRFGDCISVCKFDALKIDEKTSIPVVDTSKCTSCGACINICPRKLFELRPQGENNERVYVACSNKQKGALARKNCKSACIACLKCTKITDEVTVENNLSYIPSSIDAKKYGSKLQKSCPTGAIIYTGNSHE